MGGTMKKVWVYFGFALSSICAFGASGEFEGEYTGEGTTFKCVRNLYTNTYGKLRTGKKAKIGPWKESLTVLLDGFPSNVDVLKSALQPGYRAMIRNERGWLQLLNVQSWSDFQEGVITRVEGGGKNVTIRYYTDLPGNTTASGPRSYTISANMVVRLEGRNVSPAEAMQKGNHLRIYEPRKQAVLAMTPEATLTIPRKGHGSGRNIGWIRYGLFRAVHTAGHGYTYFCEYRNGKWIDTFATGITQEIDGRTNSPDSEWALARPGDRILTGVRIVGAPFNTTYGSYSPVDDGSVFGVITDVGANSITVKTAKSATGYAKDVIEENVTIQLNGDCEYHLNGSKGADKAMALKVGHHVRVLEAWPAGAALARVNNQSKMVSEDRTVQPLFPTNHPFEFSVGGDYQDWRQDTVLTVTENRSARLRLLLYTTGPTNFEWSQNGAVIPGTQGTVDDFAFLDYERIFTLDDNGSQFTLSGKSGDRTGTSVPIQLVVKPDQKPPQIVSVRAATKNRIIVAFDEMMRAGSGPGGAENPNNYSVTGASVSKAVLLEDRKHVALQIDKDLDPGGNFSVTVNNLNDVAGSPNTIAPGASASVSFPPSFRFMKVTLTKGGVSGASALCEIRFVEDGKQRVGKPDGANSSFGPEFSETLIDSAYKTGVKSWPQGAHVVFDFGHREISPEALILHSCYLTVKGPKVKAEGVKLEGSKNLKTWTPLVELTEAPRDRAWNTYEIDLAAIEWSTLGEVLPIGNRRAQVAKRNLH